MIITIGRQHGSSGREIARLLAKELGIKCYDKEIVDEAAKHSDFSRELINAYDEKRMSAFLLHAGGYGLNENFRLNMEVVSAQFDAIREIASKEDCIFVGRCADYVLNDRDDVVSVLSSPPPRASSALSSARVLTRLRLAKRSKRSIRIVPASISTTATRPGATRRTMICASTAPNSASKEPLLPS